jgi:DNA repair exonuclease SbcCD nuclease subunit
MRLILTSDIHFGVPNKLEHSLWASKVIREYASKNDIGVVIVLGDLFHDRTSLNIQVLTTAYDFFDDTEKNYNQEWAVFPGNHDMYLKNSWEVNSVRPLSRVVTIIEDVKALQYGGVKFWILPFVHYESAYMEVVKAIESKATDKDVLLTHIGVAGASLNECFLLKHWSVVDFSQTKFHRIYSGHFHCHQKVGDKTWYTGSPIPFRFDEGLVDHGFIEFDTETMDHKFIKTFDVGKLLLPNQEHAPDYITCVDSDVEKINVRDNHIRVCLSRDYTSNELTELRNKILSNGAKVVKWMKTKQEEDTSISNVTKSNLGDGSVLFEQWIKHDMPENIDTNEVLNLNKQIVEDGIERIASTEEQDGEMS